MKVQVKRQRKRHISKTQPDEVNCEIRGSLGEQAKQRLREISCISNLGISQSRDWTLDEVPAKLSALTNKGFQTLSQYPTTALPLRKPLQTAFKQREVDRFRRLNRTQGSMRGQEDDTARKACNSITMDFEAACKEREGRIHANGQMNIEFDSNSFNISEKVMKEVTARLHSQFAKTHHLFHTRHPRQDKEKQKALPYRKLAAKNPFLTSPPPPQQRASQLDIMKNEFALTKQFIDLRMFLMQERRSIFYPTKSSLTKTRAKSRGFS